MAWIFAALHFGSLFSYRIPNLSPGYSLASPVPSPAAVKLALVEAAIKIEGNLKFGEEVFEIVKKAPLEIEPPEKVSILKFFIKRLKPSKIKEISFEESFGIREYCHFSGPMRIYLKVSEKEEKLKFIFKQLRRLGTTDSILRCDASINEEGPNPGLTSKIIFDLKPDISNLMRRPVVTLNDIKEDIDFSQVNPYSQKKKGNPFISKTYVLPLCEIKRGENFVLYKKLPFNIK